MDRDQKAPWSKSKLRTLEQMAAEALEDYENGRTIPMEEFLAKLDEEGDDSL